MRITRAIIWPLLTPLRNPIRISFGTMNMRPSLLLQLVDENGVEGWGESWVNFPHWALSERTLVLYQLLKKHLPMLNDVSSVTAIRKRYKAEIVQSGGWGSFYHALSAIEVALWDIEARIVRKPLRNLLSEGGATVSRVPVYASGIGPERIKQRVEEAVKAGFDAVKIKVGFDSQHDHRNFEMARSVAGVRKSMVDANQAWDQTQASTEVAYYDNGNVEWVEEPISAFDFPGYSSLSRRFGCIAAGENWYQEQLGYLDKISLKAIQPDLCKVGGINATKRILNDRRIHADFVSFHALSGPVAQAVSLQVAAAWPERVKWVEFDTNENGLRDAVYPNGVISNGSAVLNLECGLGISVDPARLESFVVPDLRLYHQTLYAPGH